MLDGRPLPSSSKRERAILSTMLIDPALVSSACQRLTASDFNDEGCRAVFLSFAALNSIGAPVDMTGIHEDLLARRREGLETFAGLDDIAAVSAKSFDRHVDKLLEVSARRRVIVGAERLIESATDPETPITAVSQAVDGMRDALAGAGRITTLPLIVTMAGLMIAPPLVSDELIFGLLRRRHKMLIPGPSKVGKSFLAINLGLSLATGRDFLSFPCRLSRVLFVNFEIDHASFFYRVKAVADALGIDPALATFSILNLRGLNLPIEDLADALIDSAQGYDAIIFDPLYKMLHSRVLREVSENSSANIAAILDQHDRIAEKTGASIISVDHYSKGPQGSKAAIDRAAGSGAKGRDYDALLPVSELEGQENAYRIEFVLREFASPEPLNVVWEYPLHRQADGLSELAVKGGGAGRRRAVSDEDLRTAIDFGTVKVSELAKQFGVSEKTIKNNCFRLDGIRVVKGQVEKWKQSLG